MKNYIWDFDGTLFDTYPAMVDGASASSKRFWYQYGQKRDLLQNEKIFHQLFDQ